MVYNKQNLNTIPLSDSSLHLLNVKSKLFAIQIKILRRFLQGNIKFLMIPYVEKK